MLHRQEMRQHAATKIHKCDCDYCGAATATIRMEGYGDDASGDCNWCSACALRLARDILKDLCELSSDRRQIDVRLKTKENLNRKAP